jgi:BirA family transcriptional regulator, biotin operon repressor / biotin---[acetyl-CoA-carboxylase] ligase
MDLAQAAVLAGAAHGHVVLADQQTAGRGRLGRVWHSPNGNLYCSIILYPNLPLAQFPLYGFAAILALIAALDPLLPQHKVQAKWPNDCLVNGAKLAGFLLESCAATDGRMALIIGMGVNRAHHPEQAIYPVTSLAKELPAAADLISPVALLQACLQQLAPLLMQLETQGFGPLREKWLQRAKGLGEEITVQLPSGPLQGRFEGIDATGALLLRDATGLGHTIHVGDVGVSSIQR